MVSGVLRKSSACRPQHIYGGRKHASAKPIHRRPLAHRLQAMSGGAPVHYLDPRYDGLPIQVRLDLEQQHELLQELLDGIDALRKRGGWHRVCGVRAAFY